MKIRNDFVSNSSSSSFICHLKKKLFVTKYVDLFDELLKEPATSKKLFEYVGVNLSEVKDYDLKDKLRNCSEDNSFGTDVISDLNWQHDLNLDEANLGILSFPEYLFLYMRSDDKTKQILKDIVVMFISEACWENSEWGVEETFDDLRDFLEKSGIKYDSETAHV